MVKNEFLFYKFQVFIKYLKITTNKLQAGYQYICDNNLVINFQNYQFTELDLNERKISHIDKFHVLPPETE
jgi:hypothetical protein